jgi:hypothetical protein
MSLQEILDVARDHVRLGPDDDLDDVARSHHAVRSGRLEYGLVHQRRVGDLGPQPGDAGLDLDDVVAAAQAGDNALRLATIWSSPV